MAASALSVPFYNGYKMPIVGLGTFLASNEEVGAAVDAALEAGYRHFDTAFVYRNEAAIGTVLKKWLDAGKIKREELFIVTKLPPTGNRAASVEKYLKKSLEALQLSYVDLYLVHNAVGFIEPEEGLHRQWTPDPNTDHVSLWKAMEKQVDAGRARSIGLSNFNARQIKRVVKAARIQPANLQVELNVYFQQRELVAFCKALDITVCAYGPLGAPGLPDFSVKKDTDKSPKRVPSPLSDPVVSEVAKKHGKTPAQVLIKYIIQKGIVAIPKSSKPDRIKENFQVFDFELDESDLERLNDLDKGAKGRVFLMNFAEGMTDHPEYPFREPY